MGTWDRVAPLHAASNAVPRRLAPRDAMFDAIGMVTVPPPTSKCTFPSPFLTSKGPLTLPICPPSPRLPLATERGMTDEAPVQASVLTPRPTSPCSPTGVAGMPAYQAFAHPLTFLPLLGPIAPMQGPVFAWGQRSIIPCRPRCHPTGLPPSIYPSDHPSIHRCTNSPLTCERIFTEAYCRTHHNIQTLLCVGLPAGLAATPAALQQARQVHAAEDCGGDVRACGARGRDPHPAGRRGRGCVATVCRQERRVRGVCMNGGVGAETGAEAGGSSLCVRPRCIRLCCRGASAQAKCWSDTCER
eukprot:356396-Chlamydomonas_euryale.AAC.11